MTYTQGEWKITQPKSGVLLIHTDTKNICETSFPRTNEDIFEVAANACLIAAAPNMYQALKELRKCLLAITTPGEYAEELKQSDKALSKAEGK